MLVKATSVQVALCVTVRVSPEGYSKLCTKQAFDCMRSHLVLFTATCTWIDQRHAVPCVSGTYAFSSWYLIMFNQFTKLCNISTAMEQSERVKDTYMYILVQG